VLSEAVRRPDGRSQRQARGCAVVHGGRLANVQCTQRAGRRGAPVRVTCPLGVPAQSHVLAAHWSDGRHRLSLARNKDDRAHRAQGARTHRRAADPVGLRASTSVFCHLQRSAMR